MLSKENQSKRRIHNNQECLETQALYKRKSFQTNNMQTPLFKLKTKKTSMKLREAYVARPKMFDVLTSMTKEVIVEYVVIDVKSGCKILSLMSTIF